MSTIKITRPKKFVGGLRKFNIYLNDAKIGSIGNGETQEFQVSSGNHKLYMKQDIFNAVSIHEFSIAENETKSFTTSYRRNGIMMVFMIMSFLAAALLSQYLTDYFQLNDNLWFLFYASFTFIILMIMKAAKMFSIYVSEE